MEGPGLGDEDLSLVASEENSLARAVSVDVPGIEEFTREDVALFDISSLSVFSSIVMISSILCEKLNKLEPPNIPAILLASVLLLSSSILVISLTQP